MVATTHLFWDPNYSQIKVTQSMYLLKAIQILRTCHTPTLPVFITMDSNTQRLQLLRALEPVRAASERVRALLL